MGNTYNFNVTVYFANGVRIEKSVELSKAFKLSQKENVLVDDEAGYVEIRGVNDTIVVPINMTFVIPKSPNFKHTERVSRYMLYRRDGGKCAYCGREISQKEATIDHILPRSQGGETVWKNVALSCYKCNCLKDDRTPAQAGMKLRIKPYNPKRRK